MLCKGIVIEAALPTSLPSLCEPLRSLNSPEAALGAAPIAIIGGGMVSVLDTLLENNSGREAGGIFISSPTSPEMAAVRCACCCWSRQL